MSTFAFVDTYAYTVTYVTDKLLLSVKEIIRESGLSPAKMSSNWASLERAVSAWISSKHLSRIVLEIFNPVTSSLAFRWDLDVIYGYGGDGSLWVDTSAIKYHIRKAGLTGSSAQSPSRDGASTAEELSAVARPSLRCRFGALRARQPGRLPQAILD